jgi:hypothetical protein
LGSIIVFEVFTGIELASPYTKVGTWGRISGRNTAKLYADTSFILGLVLTTCGTFTSGATPILATVGGPIGIATAASSPALIAGGALATAQGIVLHRNYDKLSKLDLSKSNNTFIEAKNKYPKQFEQYNNLSNNGLKKAIKSHNNQISKHHEYIRNPKNHVSKWDTLNNNHRNNLLHHWKEDIKRHGAYKSLAEEILRSR